MPARTPEGCISSPSGTEFLLIVTYVLVCRTIQLYLRVSPELHARFEWVK
jgi:hypothetical protein